MKFNTKLSLVFLLIFNLLSLYQHRSILNLDIQGIHTWRQCQTMWNVRNFVRHDNHILNPRISSFNGGRDNILRYEFPLMQWGIAQVQRAFGEDIVIARLSMFMMGLIALWAFAFLVKELFNDWRVGVLSAILLQYSPLFYYYTVNPLPDVLAFTMSILYIAFIIRHRKIGKAIDLMMAAFSLLIATLCKLPFLMFSIVSIYFFVLDVVKSKKIVTPLISYALPLFVFLLPAFSWYLWVMPTWSGNPILTGQLDSFNLKEYSGILAYHLRVMFPQILSSAPLWIFIVIGIREFIKYYKDYRWILSIIGITFLYLFLELKPIGKVHDYYMFPFLIWIYLLVSFCIQYLVKTKKGIVIAILLCLITAFYTPYITRDNWSIAKTYHNDALFLYQKELSEAVPKDSHCIILNDVSGHVFSYKIDKMGHIFNDDHLPIEWIDDMVRNRGIQYMYSDSRKVDDSKEFQAFVRHMILQKGSIKVFELQLPEIAK